MSTQGSKVSLRSSTSNPRLSTSRLGTEPAFLRTSRSAWTPQLDPHNNNKLFLERIALITHWHDKWKDRQRKQLLIHLLHRTEPSELLSVRGWLLQKIPEPLWRCDPSSVLPKWLTLYIFSYLTVADLCQVCQVNSHWQYLAEQDILWRYRGAKRGWYLPYIPPDNMFGAWKGYYVLCATNSRTMSDQSSSTIAKHKEVNYTDNDLAALAQYYINVDEGVVRKGVVKKKVEEKTNEEDIDMTLFKDPWIDPDKHPKDLSKSDKIMHAHYKPDLSLMKKKVKKKSYTKESVVEVTMTESITQQGQFVYIDNNERDPGVMKLCTKTGTTVPRHNVWLTVDTTDKGNKLTLGDKTHHDTSSIHAKGSQDVGCGAVWGELLPGYSHPTVLLVSSDTPAYEVLMGAVITGVICIVYDAEESTLSSLIYRVEHVLKGRRAASIGLVVPGSLGMLHITKYCLLRQGELQPGFWRELVKFIREPKYGGRVEIFSSIGVASTPSKELGLDILYKLTSLTSVPFNGPVGGVYGEIGELAGPWLFDVDNVHPPSLYFRRSQFIAWVSLAKDLGDVTKAARNLLAIKLRATKSLLVSRVVEAVVREAWYIMPSIQVPVLADILFEAVKLLGDTELNTQPEQFKRGILCMKLVEVLLASKDVSSLENTEKGEGRSNEEEEGMRTREVGTDDVLKAQEFLKERERLSSSRAYTLCTNSHRIHYPIGVTLDQRRTVVEELYRTECDYVRELKTIEKDIFTPLYNATQGNRPLMNPSNMRICFTDIMALVRLHETFYTRLQNKLMMWDAGQGLGDILMDITGRLDCYTNFTNNYPAAITTYEKCLNKNPAFWGFITKLNKHSKSLPESFLLVFERIERYHGLIKSLLFYTSDTHHDKDILSVVLEQFVKLAGYMKVSRDRYHQIRVLQNIEKRVVNCPVLTDTNRRLIMELVVYDVKSVKKKSGEIIQTEDIFPFIKQYTTFLFNDSILLTSTEHIVKPYDELVQDKLHFVSGYHLSAVRLTTTQHPAQFSLYTPRNIWLFQCEDAITLKKWIGAVNKALTNAPMLIIPNVYAKSDAVQVFQ